MAGLVKGVNKGWYTLNASGGSKVSPSSAGFINSTALPVLLMASHTPSRHRVSWFHNSRAVRSEAQMSSGSKNEVLGSAKRGYCLQ